MPFKKGASGNTAGRPKGVGNKLPNTLRKNILDFISTEFKNIQSVYDELPPKEKLRFYVDLLQYSLPKLQAMSLDIDFDKMSEEQLDEIIERLKNSSNE